MKTVLIINTFNRKALFEKCLESVNKTWPIMDLHVLVYDDCSTDEDMRQYLYDLEMSGMAIHRSDKNQGIKKSLFNCFEAVFNMGCELAINLDGDAVVSEYFFHRLKDLKTRFPDRIISGFNCNHPKNPVLFDGGDYVERKMCNGINMCLSREDYENIVRPALLKPNNWDSNCTHDKNFIITKPSVVDHLGWNQSSMNHQNGDRACDF